MSSSSLGEKEKQKGNEAFTAGDYKLAVHHYTQAINQDKANPIYPLNRAAAHLKLGNNKEAEDDCTTAITFDPSNTKAWYRRAQARQASHQLQLALADFNQVLVLDPSNTAAKQDVQRLASSTPRRRVPIVIVDDPPTTTKDKDPTATANLLNPVSTRKLVSAGGGIFKKDGTQHVSHPSPSPTQPPTAAAAAAPTTTTATTSKPRDDLKPALVDTLPKEFAEFASSKFQTAPTSLYAFDRNWAALKSPTSKWQYLKQITPESLPSIFKESLDISLLSSLIQTFHILLTSSATPPSSPGVDPRAIKPYLLNLPRVSRWTTLVMLLGKSDKQMIRDIWDVLPLDPGDVDVRKTWGL